MIQIRETLHPFSHTPGCRCCIPGSPYTLQAFPLKLRIAHLDEVHEVDFQMTGPVKGFTSQVDIEGRSVRIFGEAKEGYFALHLAHKDQGMQLMLKRGKGVTMFHEGAEVPLHKGVVYSFPVSKPPSSGSFEEKISLGRQKKLDWDLVKRRRDLREILPVLFAVGQTLELRSEDTDLLNLEQIETLLETRFTGILSPERGDQRYLGIPWKGEALHLEEPTDLLPLCFRSLRAMMIQEKGDRISLLDQLLKVFPSGRMTGVVCKGVRLDIEWKKKSIRRVNVLATSDTSLCLDLPSTSVKTFRLRRHRHEVGETVALGAAISLEKGKRYFLDKFHT